MSKRDVMESGFFVVRGHTPPSFLQKLIGEPGTITLRIERGTYLKFMNWSSAIKGYGFHATQERAMEALLSGYDAGILREFDNV